MNQPRQLFRELEPRRRSLVIASSLILLIGIIGLALSAALSSPVAKVFADTEGLPQPVPNSSEVIPVPVAHSSASRTSVVVNFRFQSIRLFDNETLLQLSPLQGGLRIAVTPAAEGARDLDLYVGNASNETSAVLIPHLRAGSQHLMSVAVSPTGKVTVSVDHNQVFFYTFGTRSIFLQPQRFSLGADLDGSNHFYGSITSVQATTFSSFGKDSDVVRSILRIVGLAFLIISILVLAALFFLVRRRLSSNDEDSPAKQLTWRPIAVGAIFIASGALLLQYITPPDNVTDQRVGRQTLSAWQVPTGQQSQYNLGTQSNLVQNSTSDDVKLTFELETTAYPSTPVPVISTGTGRGDLQLDLYDNGFFVSNTPLGTINEVFPIAVGVFPGGEWIPVEVDEERNRTLEFRFDNQLAYSYTFDTKIWTINPGTISFGVPQSVAGVSIRHIQLTTNEYGQSKDVIGEWRIRLLQLLGALLVGGGTIILASRLARKLVPRPPKSAAALTKVAFGVLGAGIVVNILYLLNIPQTAPYYLNSTWLFAPGARFSDYFQTLELFISRNPYGIQRGSYPPFGYLLVAPFAWMERYAGLIAFLAIFFGFMGWWLVRAFTNHLGRLMTVFVVVAGLMSLPVTFAADRANTELFAAIFVILGGAALEQQRKTLSSFYFVLVGAAKIIPFAYIFIFLQRRKLRYIVFGCLIAGVVTLASFEAFTGGSISTQVSAIRAANDLASQSDLNAAIATPFNASIEGFVQAIGFAVGGPLGGQTVNNYAHHYVLLEEVIGGILIGAYILFFERTQWRLLAIATVGILLLPGESAYYSMLYLFAPLALFVKNAPWNKRTILIAVLFGLILMPKTYAFFGVGPFVDSSTLTVAPLLTLLGVATVWDSVTERRRLSTERKADVLNPQEVLAPTEPVKTSVTVTLPAS